MQSKVNGPYGPFDPTNKEDPNHPLNPKNIDDANNPANPKAKNYNPNYNPNKPTEEDQDKLGKKENGPFGPYNPLNKDDPNHPLNKDKLSDPNNPANPDSPKYDKNYDPNKPKPEDSLKYGDKKNGPYGIYDPTNKDDPNHPQNETNIKKEDNPANPLSPKYDKNYDPSNPKQEDSVKYGSKQIGPYGPYNPSDVKDPNHPLNDKHKNDPQNPANKNSDKYDPNYDPFKPKPEDVEAHGKKTNGPYGLYDPANKNDPNHPLNPKNLTDSKNPANPNSPNYNKDYDPNNPNPETEKKFGAEVNGPYGKYNPADINNPNHPLNPKHKDDPMNPTNPKGLNYDSSYDPLNPKVVDISKFGKKANGPFGPYDINNIDDSNHPLNPDRLQDPKNPANPNSPIFNKNYNPLDPKPSDSSQYGVKVVGPYGKYDPTNFNDPNHPLNAKHIYDQNNPANPNSPFYDSTYNPKNPSPTDQTKYNGASKDTNLANEVTDSYNGLDPYGLLPKLNNGDGTTIPSAGSFHSEVLGNNTNTGSGNISTIGGNKEPITKELCTYELIVISTVDNGNSGEEFRPASIGYEMIRTLEGDKCEGYKNIVDIMNSASSQAPPGKIDHYAQFLLEKFKEI